MKPIRRETIHHDSRSRDAALRRLRHANRWLIAGSAVLTGVFVDLAANAFSGHASSASARSRARAGSTHHTATTPLKPPAQAPKPAETQSTPQTTETPPPAEEQHAPETSAPEASAPAHESAPEPAPEAERHEAAPEPAPEPSEPVVSGGS
jgi:hypothetical protein